MKKQIGDYEDYKDLVALRARAYSALVDYDELLQEGFFAYQRAVQSYQPELGTFRRWLYIKLSSHFQSLQEARIRHYARTHYSDSEEGGPQYPDKVDHERRNLFLSSLGELSSEAQYLAKIIMETPLDLINLCHSKKSKITKYLLIDYLRLKGFKHAVIELIMDEIKFFLEETLA